MTESVQKSGRISVGSVLAGRYELVELLGTGGFGSVYKARQTNFDAFAALKLLNADVAPDAVALLRLQAEAKALASLDHPAIPKVHCVESLPTGGVFIAMDYIEGSSLQQLLDQRGKLPLNEAVPIFLQIADALQHAHEHGIIHRDLKPSNIMVSGDHAYVLDFGIAKNLDSMQKFTQTGAVLGTVRYMSPEQAQGQPVTPQSDIYSLACVIYETLSGQGLFDSDSPMEVLMRHVQESVPSLASAELSPLSGPLTAALAKDPAARFPSMQAFADALRAPYMVAGKRRRKTALRFKKIWALPTALVFCIAALALYQHLSKLDTEHALAEVTASDFLDASYKGPVEEAKLTAFVQDVIHQGDRLRPDEVLAKLDVARKRRTDATDWKNAVLLGQAEVSIASAFHRAHWDSLVHNVRDAMLLRDNPEHLPTIKYLNSLIREEERRDHENDTEVFGIRQMLAGQLIGAGDTKLGMRVLKPLIAADPEKQPYYYSVGQFGLLADESMHQERDKVIAHANAFLDKYGDRQPFKMFTPGFLSILGQQYISDKRTARDYWWRGYLAGRDMLTNPSAVHNDPDVDVSLMNSTAYVGAAAITTTCDLVDMGQDTKQHVEQMMHDYETRAWCQSNPDAQILVKQVAERVAHLSDGKRGGGG